MFKCVVSRLAEKKIKAGIQLLGLKDLVGMEELALGLVSLYTAGDTYLGQAYLSPQQKGVGWFLGQEQFDLNQAYFEGLFAAAKAKRATYDQDQTTTAYRLFNQDGDQFGGLTIDRYGDYALFSWYNPFVYSLKTTIVAAFQTVYPELVGGYEKLRFQGAAHESAHLYGQEAPERFVILENGVRFSVFLNDGLMTGIFLDQHEVRGRLVDGLAAGKSLLNLFSYTAAFSVAAAIGGAQKTTSVDLAKRSHELSQAHFEANGLDLADHQLVVMDVFEYFRYAKRKGLVYDVIVIDPPSFARNKKQTFSVAKDYHRLIAQALEILSEDGILVASTNASNLSLSAFRKELAKGLGQTAVREVHVDQLPADFATNPKDPTSNYLKVVTLVLTHN